MSNRIKIFSKIIIVVFIWLIIAKLLLDAGLMTTDVQNLKAFVYKYEAYAEIIFVLISTLRVITFIPSTIFIILGGLVFGPIEGFILSMCAMVFSETIIYLIGKYLRNSRLKEHIYKKYTSIVKMVDEFNYIILAIGVLTPITNTDLFCLVSSFMGLKYLKYILTIIIANIPLMLIYSYIGSGVTNSSYSIVIPVLILIPILIYSYYKYKGMKDKLKYE